MEKYRFQGLKLTPNVFKELLILLFDGRRFERQEAINKIVNYHKDHGGIVEPNRDMVHVFKNVTGSLKRTSNSISNPGFGVWELHHHVAEAEVVQETPKNDELSYPADEVFGEGENAVYVYYYDIYKRYAEMKQEAIWECKIGRSDRDPIQRIIGQAGTSYPELPHIALIFRCTDSALLEAALHSVLKIRQRWLEKAPGKEWFMTSPEEIIEIYKVIVSGENY